jgi:hypothetical protein
MVYNQSRAREIIKTILSDPRIISLKKLKFFRPQSRGLSQVPKGSRPKQKKEKLGQFSAQREALPFGTECCKISERNFNFPNGNKIFYCMQAHASGRYLKISSLCNILFLLGETMAFLKCDYCNSFLKGFGLSY